MTMLGEAKVFKFATTDERFTEELFRTDFTRINKVPTINIEDIEENQRSSYVSVLYALCLRSPLNTERLDYKIQKELRKGVKSVKSRKKAAAAG